MNFLTLAVILAAIGLAGSDYCCSFDTDVCNWQDEDAGSKWRWSANALPNVTYVPTNFAHTTNCMWLQDQGLTEPVTATYHSPSVTLYKGDVVTIQFFRYIEVYDSEMRPLLQFVSDGGRVADLTYTYEENRWITTAPVTCTANCCTIYPCTGKFQVVGSVKTPGELLAFDSLQVNGCAITTTTSTTTTTTKTTTTAPPTAAPTTAEPTTHAPPTAAPTTAAPTTHAPPTAAPTTVEPTTHAPSTQEPTTHARPTHKPTTHAPSTAEPTTHAPSTQEPTTHARPTHKPTTLEPSTAEPTTHAPFTHKPTTHAPSTQEPTTPAPPTQKPTTQEPSTAEPATPTPEPVTPAPPTTTEATTVTTIKTTTTEPISINCCDFSDSSLCTWSALTGWTWSGTAVPDWRGIPPFTGVVDYMWAQDVTTAIMFSSTLTHVTKNTTFTFDYFVSGTGSSLDFYFVKSGSSKMTLLGIGYTTNNAWTKYTLDCHSYGFCCESATVDSCSGQLRIEGITSKSNPSSSLLAFDNFERDLGC